MAVERAGGSQVAWDVLTTMVRERSALFWLVGGPKPIEFRRLEDAEVDALARVHTGRSKEHVPPENRVTVSAAERTDETFALACSMNPARVAIHRVQFADDLMIEQLAALLIDCVEGGASVSFLHPLTPERAEEFWSQVATDTANDRRVLLVAEDSEGVCGTVQLVLDLPENQAHRADLCKMLVHRRARRRGVGEALMRAAEAAAIECGRTLLVLDAVTGGDAARLYERLGWVRVGDIPRYALMPDGTPCGTTYFYRDLSGPRPT